MKRVVITGPRHSGKSTFIKFLNDKGYPTIQIPFNDLLATTNVVPGQSLSDKILANYLLLENGYLNSFSKYDLTFSDRCIVDFHSFFRGLKMPIPSKLLAEISRSSFYKVFFFEMIIPITPRPGKLNLSEQQVLESQERILEIYSFMKIPLIRVPAMPVIERYAFIADHLNSSSKEAS